MSCCQSKKLCRQYFTLIIYPIFTHCAIRGIQRSSLGQRCIYCKGLCLSIFVDNTIQIWHLNFTPLTTYCHKACPCSIGFNAVSFMHGILRYNYRSKIAMFFFFLLKGPCISVSVQSGSHDLAKLATVLLSDKECDVKLKILEDLILTKCIK